MTEDQLKEIADAADMIVSGYAFKRTDRTIHVFNLNDGQSTMVMNENGEVQETSMNEFDQAKVQKIWALDSEFMDYANGAPD